MDFIVLDFRFVHIVHTHEQWIELIVDVDVNFFQKPILIVVVVFEIIINNNRTWNNKTKEEV